MRLTKIKATVIGRITIAVPKNKLLKKLANEVVIIFISNRKNLYFKNKPSDAN